MTSWESIVLGALQGFSNFVTSFINIIGTSINAEAIEGFIAIFAVVIIYRVAQGEIKIPRPKVPKLRRRDDDDDEYEYIRVRRRRKK